MEDSDNNNNNRLNAGRLSAGTSYKNYYNLNVESAYAPSGPTVNLNNTNSDLDLSNLNNLNNTLITEPLNNSDRINGEPPIPLSLNDSQCNTNNQNLSLVNNLTNQNLTLSLDNLDITKGDVPTAVDSNTLLTGNHGTLIGGTSVLNSVNIMPNNSTQILTSQSQNQYNSNLLNNSKGNLKSKSSDISSDYQHLARPDDMLKNVERHLASLENDNTKDIMMASYQMQQQGPESQNSQQKITSTSESDRKLQQQLAQAQYSNKLNNTNNIPDLLSASHLKVAGGGTGLTATEKTRVSTTRPLVLRNCSIGEFISNITEEKLELKAVLVEEQRIFSDFSQECRGEVDGLTDELKVLQGKLKEERETLDKLKVLRREQVESTERLLGKYKTLRDQVHTLEDTFKVKDEELGELRRKVTDTESEVESMRGEIVLRKRAHTSSQGASESTLKELEQDVERIHTHSTHVSQKHEQNKQALLERLSSAQVELKTIQLETEAVKTKGFEAEQAHQLRLQDIRKERELEEGERALLIKKLTNATEMNGKLQRIAGRRGVSLVGGMGR